MKVKLVFGIILASLFAIGVLFLVNLFKNPFEKPDIKIDASRASVIKEIKQLQRLETASFSIEKIIEAGTSGNAFQEVLYGDRILLIAHGKVIAGFDLATLEENDIIASGDKVTLTLPAPQILLSALDSEKTKVYDRKLGLLSKGDKDLEAQARQQAEISIKQAACEARILDEASINAKKQLTALLNALGFANVEIIHPQGSC